MAFCNSCGANLASDVKFCSKCGAVTSASSATPIPATPSAGSPQGAGPAPTQGGSALKVVLIVVAVIVGIGILGIAAVIFVGVHFARNAHVTQEGDHVKVETPFGNVETSKDPDEVARNLRIEIYPGAKVRQDGAASASFGGVHSVTANFDSSDSADKICEFYKSKYPTATVKSSDQDRCTIVTTDPKNVVTINVEGGGGTTHFQIANVTRNSSSSN